MSTEFPSTRRLIARWAIGGATVGWFSVAACGMWYEVGQRRQIDLVEELASRALASPAGAHRAEISELERLVGVGPLVRLAASQRVDVATAAQASIDRLLATWEAEATATGDVARLAANSVLLASALDDQLAAYGAEGQRWANQLAERLTIHSDQFPMTEAWEILAHCDHLLSRPLLPLAAKPRMPMDELPTLAVEAVRPPVDTDASVESKPAAETSRPLQIVGRPLGELAFVEPLMPTTDAGRSLEPDGKQPRPPLRLPDLGAATEEASANRGARAVVPVGPVIDVPSPQEARQRSRALRGTSNQSLTIKAVGPGAAGAAAGSHVLRSGGSSDAALELTRQLQALTPEERRSGLDRASQLSPTDARQVLRSFVADGDAEVRLKALTILATAGDPRLAELARERAIEDADPRVAAFASELMRTR